MLIMRKKVLGLACAMMMTAFSDTIQNIQQIEPGASVHEGFALHHKDMDKAEEMTQHWLNQMGFTK